MTHTPGPWSLSGDLIVGAPEPRPNPNVEPYPHSVAKLCWDFGGDRSANGDLPWETAEANARLIVSAPDMLNTLRAIRNDCEAFLNGDSDISADDLLAAIRDACLEEMDTVRS